VSLVRHLLLPALCLTLAACGAPAIRLQLNYDTNLYALDGEGRAGFNGGCTTRVSVTQLTCAERRNIADTAARIGFFDLPASLDDLPPEPKADMGLLNTLSITSACDNGELELGVGGRRNIVHWNCNTAHSLGQGEWFNDAPKQIQPLLDAIRAAFAAHSEISGAPQKACHGY